MACVATIGLIQPDGSTVHVWTTAGGKPNATHRELLVCAIGEHKLDQTGGYIVATINSGKPYASIFTVTKNNASHWHIAPGLPQPGRVNRWPPKA